MSWLAKVREKIKNFGDETKRQEQIAPLKQFMDRFPNFRLGEPSADENNTLTFPILNSDNQNIAQMQATWGDNGMYSGVVGAKISRLDPEGSTHSVIYNFGESATALAFLSSHDGRPPENAQPENDQFDTFDRRMK